MATDVASKGLDFPAIQHVINYDMPEEIENYGGSLGGALGIRVGCRLGPSPGQWARGCSLSLQCTELAVLGAQEIQASPPPSSTRPVVSLSPGPPQLSPRSSRSWSQGLGWNLMVPTVLTDESVLMDLKALLLEAKQKVPPVLQVLHCGDESMLDIGGDYRMGDTSPVRVMTEYYKTSPLCTSVDQGGLIGRLRSGVWSLAPFPY